MRLPKHEWPNTDGSRGILLFAQLMSEMLTPTTFESFRVYSLDTTSRIFEALELLHDVRQERIPRQVLEPIIEELKWSLKKDPAARNLAGGEIESLLNLLGTSFSLEDFTSHLRLIQKLVGGHYKKTIELLLLELFDKPDKRMDFRKLVGFYCCHLINLGYDRNHVRQVLDDSFYSSPVVRMGRKTLEKFLNCFDAKQRRYIVQAGVTRDLGNYLRGLEFDVHTRLNTGSYAASLTTNSNTALLPAVFGWSTVALDPHSAMNSAYQFLSAQRAISFLDPYGMHCEWGDTMHVTLHRAKSGCAITKADFLENKQRPTSPVNKRPQRVTRARTISNYAADIARNFDGASTERLLSSIRTAALARTSFNPENRLISLWSAIEVLLSEPRDDARIVHYARLVVPCIVMRHTRRQVIAVYNELLPRYRSRLNTLTRSMETESHGHEAFAELVFLPENQQHQAQLCTLLAENPLALHRVFKLQRDYKNVKAVNATIDDHADRVRWQIHRVYRARNQLVHAGRMPTYLESIILNLAEYYRSAVATIVGRAKREEEASDIDQIVSEIGIRYGILCNHFRKSKADSPLTQGDVAKLMGRM
ncbi:hypothetical protein G6M14_07555 [Agrobacterium tumefaciens]|uniref:hypothetical protein n=1 Tax=Agrobacterium tumefaciens TaxID=358 RepID=UPI0015747D81|nr:hypothetical protein [Agrobacterium tumefaciens]